MRAYESYHMNMQPCHGTFCQTQACTYLAHKAATPCVFPSARPSIAGKVTIPHTISCSTLPTLPATSASALTVQSSCRSTGRQCFHNTQLATQWRALVRLKMLSPPPHKETCKLPSLQTNSEKGSLRKTTPVKSEEEDACRQCDSLR